jgi:hypothetical protein
VILLKKFFLFLFITLIFLPAAFAETYAPAVITKNETWIPKYSPYIVDGTVTIEKTGFLTIMPGTVVKFKEDSKIFVKGALYSKGDPKNPVRMLPYDITSFYDGIVFESRYKNTIEFTIIIRGAITSKGSQVSITNNYILNSTGIELYHFSTALIKDNYFYNDTYGVYIEGKEVKYTIGQNTFNNGRFAIYIKDTPKAEGVILKNNFFKNVVNVTNYSPADIEAKDNYWGYSEEPAIQKFIYDKRNNEKAGKVVYAPFAKAPYGLWEPTDAFISLVKIYLNMKRPDEEPTRISIGGGAIGLMPLAPKYLSAESNFGLGLDAEFTSNITGAFLWGLQLQNVGLENKRGDTYRYNMSVANIMANGIGYIGWKRNVFFIPYTKLGLGASIVSEQYKYDDGTTKKYNNICFTAGAGAGLEWFVVKFASLKLEAMFNATLNGRGAILYPVAGLTANLYFDTPFYVNDRGTAGPY